MFTDWAQVNPSYFYWRGVLRGVVVTNLVWILVVPYIKRKLNGK